MHMMNMARWRDILLTAFTAAVQYLPCRFSDDCCESKFCSGNVLIEFVFPAPLVNKSVSASEAVHSHVILVPLHYCL
jgi:hypothetical protein